MTHVTPDAATLTNVGVAELSPSQWRVTDVTIADGDPSGSLGFIQRFGDLYEVMKLNLPRDRFYVGSLDRAKACFVDGSILAGSMTPARGTLVSA
jgi:hypothetical protein